MLRKNRQPSNEATACIHHMLEFSRKNNGVVWSIIFNKEEYNTQYSSSLKIPHQLCLNDLLERVQSYLQRNNEYAVCIFDQYKKHDDIFFSLHRRLVKEGSHFQSGSSMSTEPYSFKIDRILDFYLANSKNSLGIKVADFIARATYQLLKCEDKVLRKKITWRKQLIDSLDADESGCHSGYGTKFIPSRATKEL